MVMCSKLHMCLNFIVFVCEFEYACRCVTVQKYTGHGKQERGRPRANIIGEEGKEEFSGKTRA